MNHKAEELFRPFIDSKFRLILRKEYGLRSGGRRVMLFSQRKGLKPIKSIIQVDSLDKDLRNGLWTAVTIWQRGLQETHPEQFQSLMAKFWLSYYKEPLDTLRDGNYVFHQLRNEFFDGEWNG